MKYGTYLRNLTINFSGTKIMSPGRMATSSLTFFPCKMSFSFSSFTSTQPGEIRW